MLNLEALGLERLEVRGDRIGGESYQKHSRWSICATLKAENWTPWWGGDHETKVRDPRSLRVTSRPNSETLKGVIRWVLRAALAATVDADIETLDSILAGVYGGVGPKGEHLDSLVRLVVEPPDPTRIERCESRVVKAAVGAVRSVYSKRGFRQREEERARYYKLIGGGGGFEKIVANARFELATMGGGVDDALRLLPVPPGCMEINVGVEVDEARLEALGVNPRDVCLLTLLAVVYALEVKGLGRGANRGFGRFRVKQLEAPMLSEREAERASRLASSLVDSGRVEDALREIHERLVELAGRVFAGVARGGGGCGGCAPSLRWLKSIDGHGVYVQVVRGAKHPAPVSVRGLTGRFSKVPVRDVYDALSAIARAFTKNVWKKYSSVYEGRVNEPGVALHSWIAGLPRWQQATGYELFDVSMVGRLHEQNVKGVAQGSGGADNTCLPENDVKRAAAGARRSSAIIAYPLPDASTIVIVAYVTLRDHEAVLTGSRQLYHVGRHGDIRAPCRHVVRVAWAASKEKIPAPRTRCRRGCGEDRIAGVAYPDNTVQVGDSRSLVLEAYKSVLEHLLNVLR